MSRIQGVSEFDSTRFKFFKIHNDQGSFLRVQVSRFRLFTVQILS